MKGGPLQRRGMGCPVPNHGGRVEWSETEIFLNILPQSLQNSEVFPELVFCVVVTWNSVDG